MSVQKIGRRKTLKTLYLPYKFRQFGTKIKILSYLLKNKHTDQFKGAGKELDWF